MTGAAEWRVSWSGETIHRCEKKWRRLVATGAQAQPVERLIAERGDAIGR